MDFSHDIKLTILNVRPPPLSPAELMFERAVKFGLIYTKGTYSTLDIAFFT